MPELPEVETVRLGLLRWVVGRTIESVQVLHPRAVRRYAGGGDGFAAALTGRRVVDARRRGKYLWLALDPRRRDEGGDAIVCHLGMSGQLLVLDEAQPPGPHLRARFTFTDGGPQLRFVDQRTFGALAVSAGGAVLPAEIAHIALDPFDPQFDLAGVVRRLRERRTGIKRALLDQTLISGVGNIYADESLWWARLHGERVCSALPVPRVRELVGHVTDVMASALSAGGTSFDSLYVNVNGESGYFERSLSVYGREGKPCPRCAGAIRREPFMNRSSYSCPKCQRRPALDRSASLPMVRDQAGAGGRGASGSATGAGSRRRVALP